MKHRKQILSGFRKSISTLRLAAAGVFLLSLSVSAQGIHCYATGCIGDLADFSAAKSTPDCPLHSGKSVPDQEEEALCPHAVSPDSEAFLSVIHTDFSISVLFLPVPYENRIIRPEVRIRGAAVFTELPNRYPDVSVCILKQSFLI